jgi:23S rRNA pseudouridine1911/1915/1917 synthase
MTSSKSGSPCRLLVRSTLGGERLDRFLAAETGLSRRRSRLLAGEGKVCINGRVTRVLSKPVAPGDVIDVLVPETSLPNEPWRPEPVTFRFDDRWVAIAEKPAGILSQRAEVMRPGETAFDEQVLQALAWRHGRRPFLRLIHRLDRHTSGLVVFARNPEALKPIDQAWRSRRVTRFYLAAVSGRPEWRHTSVEEPIGRDQGHNWKFRVDPGGKRARTKMAVLEQFESTTLVVCELETGRTHQVRVHLEHLGLPVVGDRLYGGAATTGGRLMLHAWALSLPHPKTRQELRLTAALPPEFKTLVTAHDIEPPWRNS